MAYANTFVIPEAAKRLSGIHNPDSGRTRTARGYGFRARASRAPE